MPKLRLFLIYGLVAAIIVAWFVIAPRLLQTPTPPGATIAPGAPIEPRAVPDFQLTNQRGEAITRESLAGRVWVANFIFSSCPGPCLNLTHRMHALEQALAELGHVSLVSFSIDPTNDTPAKLSTYATQVGAGPRWHFLTGARPITARVATEGFLFPLSSDPTDFNHSERIAVVDRAGMVRGWFDSDSPKLIEEVKALVATL